MTGQPIHVYSTCPSASGCSSDCVCGVMILYGRLVFFFFRFVLPQPHAEVMHTIPAVHIDIGC
jgi:hypothetical protein